MTKKSKAKASKPPERIKSAVFSTRMDPNLRAKLERAAQQSRRSITGEVTSRLLSSFDASQLGAPHNEALAHFLAHIMRAIEARTGLRWRDDPFTAQALCVAIDVAFRGIVQRKGLDRPAETPEHVKQDAERSAPHLARYLAPEQVAAQMTPEGIGAAVARGALGQLEAHQDYPDLAPRNVHYADHFYSMPKMNEDMGLTSKGRRKS